jgi:hypothetical protein
MNKDKGGYDGTLQEKRFKGLPLLALRARS